MVELILRLNELLTPAGASDPDVVQAFFQFIPAAIAGASAIGSALSGRSAGKKAERLQRQQIEEARGYRDFARDEYEGREPLRDLAFNRILGFQGAPGNPFTAQLFGQPGAGAGGGRGGGLGMLAQLLRSAKGGDTPSGGGPTGMGTPSYNPDPGSGVSLRRIDPRDPLTMYSIGVDRSQRPEALEAIYRSLGLG